jgi:CubicO group peptidase (beta-lactamase class C family)
MRLVAVILGVFLALPANVPEPSTNVEQRVDQLFAIYDKPDSPGCALGVIRNGSFVYRKAYGMGSLELGVPLSTQSVFYMGSVSKQFTAASVVLAAEQGYLSLDDDVRTYIPEIPDYGQRITLRQMLHHTSGFPDVLSLLVISGRNPAGLHSNVELMDLIVRQKALNYSPQGEYLYSNTNYFLLAEVLKRATKQPLSEFAAQNIFRPLGMVHTRFYDDHTVVVPGRVAAYSAGKHGTFLVNWSTDYDTVGGGGLMSSVDDLLLWDRNFYQNKLGKGTLLKEMQTRGILNGGAESNYALGLLLNTYRGLPIVEHGGALFGYQTEIIRFPEQKFSVVCLCNLSSADPDSLTHKVADIYLEKELQREQNVAIASGSDPALFAGKYFDSQRHFLVSFASEGGNLIEQGDRLKPIGANRFEDEIVGGTFTFSSDTDGAMNVTVVYNNEVTFEGKRIGDFRADDEALAAYAGVYRSNELDATYRLSVENGSLILRMNSDAPIKLKPIVQNEFDAGYGITLSFGRDNKDHPSGLSVFAGWNDQIRNETFAKIN